MQGGEEKFFDRLKAAPNILSTRADGLSASLRGSSKAGVFAAASATTGVYALYNVDNYYGLGTQGAPAMRNDFTTKTMAGRTTKLGDMNFLQGVNSVLNRLQPFRGDKVNVIDYGKRSHHQIYRWLPSNELFGNAQGKFGKALQKTNRFIQKAQKFLGSNPYGRSIDMSFTVYATSRDEMKFIYRKLNYLAGYTAPEYKNNSISLVGPWLRVTVGDLFVSVPAIINSLSYTLVDSDTVWEINIEEDKEMKQVPHKISVSIGLDVITNELPEKGGAFYSLGDKHTYDKNMHRTTGIDKNGKETRQETEKDWLGDAKQSGLSSGKKFFLNQDNQDLEFKDEKTGKFRKAKGQ